MNKQEHDAVVERMHKRLGVYRHCVGYRGLRRPFFTGFKSDVFLQNMADEVNQERLATAFPGGINFVGQWLWYGSHGGPYYYVNVPGVQLGRYERGDAFDIGSQRFTINTHPAEIHWEMTRGLLALARLIHPLHV